MTNETKISNAPQSVPTENEIILRLIDLHLKEIHHNNIMAWQGINRSKLVFGFAIAICTFVQGVVVDNLHRLYIWTAIAAITFIIIQLLLFVIKRNIEHTYQYNNALRELEKLLKVNFKQSKWVKYLINVFYDEVLEGTKTGRHTKQVIKAIPWTFLIISGAATVCFLGWIFCTKYSDLVGGIIAAIASGIILCFLPYGIKWLLGRIYRKETKEWENKFEEFQKSLSSCSKKSPNILAPKD